MATYEIPTNNSSPAFDMFTDLDGVNYTFNFRWNDRIGMWMFDLYDSDNVAIFLGKPYQTEVDFLQQSVKTTTPTGTLMAINSEEDGVDADRFSLGGNVKLYYKEVEDA